MPPLDAVEMAAEQERRKMFLRYLSRGWLAFGGVTLLALPLFPEQRSVFIYLMGVTFPTFLLVWWLNESGRTRLAGGLFTLLVNFGFYGLFIMLVGELGAQEAFDTQATVWMLLGLAIIFAGASVDKWAAPGLALFNTLLLIGTRLVLAPEADPRPSVAVLWWILALTIWLYERTLEQSLGRLRKVRGNLEELIQIRTQKLEETVTQLELAKNQLEAKNQELEKFSLSISQELYESEARFQRIFQISPAPMAIIGQAGFIEVNDAFLQMGEYAPEDLIGKTSAEINLWANPVDREKALAILAEQGVLRDFEMVFRKKSGQQGIGLMAVATYKQPDGENRYLCHLLDITARKQAEENLGREHRLLRTVIDNLPDYIYLKDSQHRCLVSNLANARSLGIKRPEEVVGKTLFDFYPPEEAERYSQFDKQVLETGAPIHIENQFMDLETGQMHWTWMTRIPFLSSDGTISGVVGISRDITERKRLERELQEERDFVLQIINTMGQGLTVTDENGYFVLVNPAAARLVGGEPKDWVGKLNRSVIAPEDFPIVLQAREARLSGKSSTYEVRVLRDDGTKLPVLITGVPRFKGDRFVGSITIITDLTELKRAEQALRESEARYRAVVENQTEFIVRWKPDGTRTFVNEAYLRYFGLTQEQALAENFLSQMAEGERSRVEAKIARLVSGVSISETDIYPSVRPDGRMAWHEWTDRAIYNEQGEVIEIQSVGRDITEQREAEQKIHELNADLERRVLERTAQLEAMNKELEAFSYSVSHDLRAPLRAINGFSQVLAEELTSSLSDTHQRYFQLIQNNVHRMNRLIEDLLAFSRLGRQPLRKQRVEMDRLIQNVLAELHPDLSGRQVEFLLSPLPDCEADPGLLHQVWINLLSNALKYSRPREFARIEVGWEPRKEGPVYFVRDNGVGFDMHYAHKLFGVFQRLHRQDDFEGTGVGLAIVQRIIHRHGGRVWFEAEVERGATFYFSLGEPIVME
ncbi:MAG: hypothetical protein Fur0022_14160 [Anaerolineales bacterium]